MQQTPPTTPSSQRLFTLSSKNSTRWKKLTSGDINSKKIPVAQFLELISLDLRNFKGEISSVDDSQRVSRHVDFLVEESSHFFADSNNVQISEERLVLSVLGLEIDLNEVTGLSSLALTENDVFLSLLFLPLKGCIHNTYYYYNIHFRLYQSIIIIFFFLILSVYNNGVFTSNESVLFIQINETLYINKPTRIRRDFSKFWPNQYSQSNLTFTLGNNSLSLSQKHNLSSLIHRPSSFFLNYLSLDFNSNLENIRKSSPELFSLNDILISANDLIVSTADTSSDFPASVNCLWVDAFNQKCILCESLFVLDIDGTCVAKDALPLGMCYNLRYLVVFQKSFVLVWSLAVS
jgi:hypothetical protein